MKFEFKNEEECKVISSILDGYEVALKEGKIVSFGKKADNMIEHIRRAVDKYRIGASYDIIGVVECPNCQKRWTAVCAETTPEVRCPRCKMMVKVPSAARKFKV